MKWVPGFVQWENTMNHIVKKVIHSVFFMTRAPSCNLFRKIS